MLLGLQIFNVAQYKELYDNMFIGSLRVFVHDPSNIDEESTATDELTNPFRKVLTAVETFLLFTFFGRIQVA